MRVLERKQEEQRQRLAKRPRKQQWREGERQGVGAGEESMGQETCRKRDGAAEEERESGLGRETARDRLTTGDKVRKRRGGEGEKAGECGGS